MKTILITGGYGFIGSNFIKHIYDSHDYNIINIDKLTYAANINNISDEIKSSDRYTFINADINDTATLDSVVSKYSVNYIVNFAAESHVDNSISNSKPFIDTNINGTHSLLSLLHTHPIEKYLQVSTDEVYGSLFDTSPPFTEDNPIAPNSPYSASKASADLLCRSFYETYKYPILITRCSNNYGPNQHSEKLIPLMIKNAKEGKKLPVYGNGKNIRDWIHVSDHCRAIDKVLHASIPGQVYNIGGENEMRNIDIVKKILTLLNLSFDQIEYVKDRKGHDWRYAIDNTKIKLLKWKPLINFETGISALI